MKQHKAILSFTFLYLITLSSSSQEKTKLNEVPLPEVYDDGPYVYIDNSAFVKKTIRSGMVKSTMATSDRYDVDFLPEDSIFTNVSKVIAASDIHGQHDIFISLLKQHHVINDNLDWVFGDGHFVVTGDIFDRGSKILDSLWLILKLEKQARQKVGEFTVFLVITNTWR